MPDVKIYGPKIGELGTKRVLVKEITDALEKAYKLPRRSYVVTIIENMPENVGIGGVLNIDEKPST